MYGSFKIVSKTIYEPNEQKEAHECFMIKFFTQNEAKIKVTKYDKNASKG